MSEKRVMIRIAEPGDVAELLEIYAPYVRNTAITFEYDVPSVSEFRERILHIQKRYPYLVAEADREIVGYAYAGAFYECPAYDWVVETSIYVRQDMKRTGIGSRLYQEIEKILTGQGILNIYACIAYPPEEDEYLTRDSVWFHHHLGYQIVGHFHQCGYKFGRWYDMVWMEKCIGGHRGQPEIETKDMRTNVCMICRQ